MYKDISLAELDKIVANSWDAFLSFRKTSPAIRANLMRAIATELENCGDELIHLAMKETNLPELRLRNEKGRTIFQLNQYAEACAQGSWMEVRIDTAVPDKAPPKPDIRKMMVPVGPVVVFGASNFPFAYSTAGGDTATAIAAGCPVIVKAHPAHPGTSLMVSNAIQKALQTCGLSEHIFQHVFGASFEVGKALVQHPKVFAVGFTGSFKGGKQLYDWAQERKDPIPVFAEMGSVNPIFLLPEQLNQKAGDLATQIAGSITLGVGQFCTNPGLIIGIEGEPLQNFMHDLGKAIQQASPGNMLHQGIADAYRANKSEALLQENVHLIAESEIASAEGQGQPTIATTSGANFLANPLLHQEVFGPYSLVIVCKNAAEMLAVAQSLEGQLTTTLMATENDLLAHQSLVDQVELLCGRIVYNGVPTGVEVCLSMQHGGPFPSSTDGRFGSVGADAIKRFIRPLAYQNCADTYLPDALKNENLLNIPRTINNVLTYEAIS